MSELIVLVPAFFLTATLFSAVGNAGASGYLAAMAMVGVDPVAMKPTALVVNILVAAVGTARYARAGQLQWRTLAPFVVGSVPFAALGGFVHPAGPAFRGLVAFVLVASAVLLVVQRRVQTEVARRPSVPLAVASGAGIGLLAGVTGTGGGVFLGPLLLLEGWERPRGAAGACAAFILINSIAALCASPSSLGGLTSSLPWLGAAAVAGGLLGTELGTRRFPERPLRGLLASVLMIAAVKLAAS